MTTSVSTISAIGTFAGRHALHFQASLLFGEPPGGPLLLRRREGFLWTIRGSRVILNAVVRKVSMARAVKVARSCAGNSVVR